MRFIMMLAVFTVLTITPAYSKTDAQPIEIYHFDKAHTQILFFVNHLGFSTSQGEFLDYDGSFEFNRNEPEKSKVEIIFKTSGIDMDDDKWDESMKSDKFFNVEKFPSMIFKSTKIIKTGDNTGKITGDLTILKTTKSVVLDVIFNKAAVHPFSQKYVAGFSAKAKIKRSDFDMKYGLPLVGDDVDIMIEVEGVRQNGEILNN